MLGAHFDPSRSHRVPRCAWRSYLCHELKQAINRSGSHAVSQSVSQPTNRPTNQPIGRSDAAPDFGAYARPTPARKERSLPSPRSCADSGPPPHPPPPDSQPHPAPLHSLHRSLFADPRTSPHLLFADPGPHHVTASPPPPPPPPSVDHFMNPSIARSPDQTINSSSSSHSPCWPGLLYILQSRWVHTPKP